MKDRKENTTKTNPRAIFDLKELEKLISDHQILIDTISHDIKNPLTNIVLALEMVSEVPHESPDLKAGLEIIERSTVRIKAMVEDLNNRRKESSVQTAEAELLNIENIVEDVFVALTMQIQHSQALISIHIGVSEIIFSRRKLRSILYNLISNAIKYRSAERACQINISTMRQKHGVFLLVADNGIGIEPENQEKVFNKYYRVQSEQEGSGIGLTWCGKSYTTQAEKSLLKVCRAKEPPFLSTSKMCSLTDNRCAHQRWHTY